MKQRPPSRLARADAHDVCACRADSSARSSAAAAAAPAAAALPGAHRQSSLHTDLRSFQRRQMRAFACAPQPGRPLQAPLAHGRVAPTPAVRATTPRSAMDAPVRLFCATFLIWQLRRLLPDGSKNGLGVKLMYVATASRGAHECASSSGGVIRDRAPRAPSARPRRLEVVPAGYTVDVEHLQTTMIRCQQAQAVRVADVRHQQQ